MLLLLSSRSRRDGNTAVDSTIGEGGVHNNNEQRGRAKNAALKGGNDDDE